MSAQVGVVVALLAEAAALGLRRPKPGLQPTDGHPRLIHISGMGADAATCAATALADAGATALLSFGTAGALAPDLGSGDVVCPRVVIDQDGLRYVADSAWRQRLAAGNGWALNEGALLTAKLALTGRDEKYAAQLRYGAVAVDMETAAVAAVAKQRGLPFLALRAIVDEADTELPAAVIAATDAWGRPRPFSLIRGLLRAPSSVRQLPGLARAFNLASGALRTIAETTPDFAWPPAAADLTPASPSRV
jgi:adenosylhomocysteine nucleosidase